MNSKLLITLTALLCLGLQLFSQEHEGNFKIGKPKLEIGYLHIYNQLNSDQYFKYKFNYATDNSDLDFGGVSLKLTYPTNFKNLDLVVGSVFIKVLNEFVQGHTNAGSILADDYVSNGGGVYWGISPKLKGKHVGLTSEFGIGVFSFKEYVSIVNNVREPFVDLHNTKASSGLGAISSVGMYANWGRLGISPSLVGIFSGGSNASFTFYGLQLPITYQF